MLGNAKKVGEKRWNMEKELWKLWNNFWKTKRNLILIIDFDVEKSRQKKLNSILKWDLICIVEKNGKYWRLKFWTKSQTKWRCHQIFEKMLLNARQIHKIEKCA